jgi:hypothetical protein
MPPMRSFESVPVTMRPEILVYTSLLNVVKTLGASSAQHQFPIAWAGCIALFLTSMRLLDLLSQRSCCSLSRLVISWLVSWLSQLLHLTELTLTVGRGLCGPGWPKRDPAATS